MAYMWKSMVEKICHRQALNYTVYTKHGIFNFHIYKQILLKRNYAVNYKSWNTLLYYSACVP